MSTLINSRVCTRRMKSKTKGIMLQSINNCFGLMWILYTSIKMQRLTRGEAGEVNLFSLQLKRPKVTCWWFYTSVLLIKVNGEKLWYLSNGSVSKTKRFQTRKASCHIFTIQPRIYSTWKVDKNWCLQYLFKMEFDWYLKGNLIAVE